MWIQLKTRFGNPLFKNRVKIESRAAPHNRASSYNTCFKAGIWELNKKLLLMQSLFSIWPSQIVYRMGKYKKL